MSYRTTQDIVRSVLTRCGELSDGTSSYHERALEYVNSAYGSLLSGGSEFGVDISDSWSWALAQRPLVLVLSPPITGSSLLTLDSNVGLFSVAPLISLDGYVLRMEGYSELYTISGHGPGDQAFTIDQPYGQTTGTRNFTAYRFDYDLVDDSIVVSVHNNKIDFAEGGTTLTATLTTGSYTPVAFAAHVSTKMMEEGALVYNHSFDSVGRIFTWEAGGDFSLLLSSGPNASRSPSIAMGLDAQDYTGASIYMSDYALNGIDRLIAPMQVYGNERMTNGAPGQIFEIDLNTFVREYHFSRTTYGIPDRYCITQHRPNGIVSVKFNGAPATATRVEIPYIPVHQRLTNTPVSFPVLPIGFRDYLIHAASYFLLVDKADNKADTEAALAKAKLLGLQNFSRRSLSKAGESYGRVVPRSR